MWKTGANARHSLQFFVAVFANYNYFREIFGKNVHVWILSINMLANTKFVKFSQNRPNFAWKRKKTFSFEPYFTRTSASSRASIPSKRAEQTIVKLFPGWDGRWCFWASPWARPPCCCSWCPWGRPSAPPAQCVRVHPKSNWKMWIKREWLQLGG